MSYTPPEQLLADRATNVVTSLDELYEAMEARIDDPNEWRNDHLLELENLQIDMLMLKKKINKIKRNNR